MYFLSINAGSSSIKFCLFDAESLTQDYVGAITGIGFGTSTFTISGKQTLHQDVNAPDHATAGRVILEWIAESIVHQPIGAIGHRIVHGGPKFTESCIVTDNIISELRTLAPIDPEHLPMQIALVEFFAKELPDATPIACFDTAFFAELPTISRLLPLPRHLEAVGIRRYGFHGLSYTYLLEEFENVAGQAAARGRVILAHLGNGASLAAVNDGKPIDTSMGFTPVGGIPMSTRSGDLDPGILSYLGMQKGLSAEQINTMVGFESGLLGISETTADMKELLDLEANDSRAHEAVEIFCYQVRKYIGSYAAALGGINSLIFSGGIGEVSAPIRARICDGLDFLGVQIDNERNQANAELISIDGAGVGVHILATNEALTIAHDMQRLISQTNSEAI